MQRCRVIVRYGFFAAEKDDDAALDSRVEAMCREIGSRAKNDESTPVLPDGVANESPIPSSAPAASAVKRAAVPQVPASAPGPATILPPSESAQLSSGTGSAVLSTDENVTAATMREIQALLHAEADRARAQAEAQQKAIQEAMDMQREACVSKAVLSDDQIRALQVLSSKLGLALPPPPPPPPPSPSPSPLSLSRCRARALSLPLPRPPPSLYVSVCVF
eukprot:SAG11_NODE_1021_length_6157_cov_1.321063_4_plen_220_part_00